MQFYGSLKKMFCVKQIDTSVALFFKGNAFHEAKLA